MSEWIVLLGGNELNAGVAEYAASRKRRLLVVDWNERPDLVGDRHVRLDIKDTSAVVAALEPYLADVRLAISSADVAAPTVAAIHARLGHRVPTSDALLSARDKARMNEIWASLGLLNKRYRHCETFDDLKQFRDGLDGRDLIVKPKADASSRGVTALRGEDATSDSVLRLAWDRASTGRAGASVLAEDYVEGTEFTVEMLGDAYGAVRVCGISKKYHTKNAGRNRVATKLHYNAPDVSSDRRQKIGAFAQRCYQAVGLRAALGHFEVFERPDGSLVPVEIAARSSGYILTHLVDGAAGRGPRYLEQYEAVLAGERVDHEVATCEASSMYFFYDLPPGLGLRDDSNLMQSLPQEVRSLASNRSALRRGHELRSIDSDTERQGFEILVGPPTALTIENVVSAENELRNRFMITREAFDADPTGQAARVLGADLRGAPPSWEALVAALQTTSPTHAA
jgi:phosphoribosylaminoimidazole carboxylase (NCAIR synthetase)